MMFTLVSHEKLTAQVRRMVLRGDTSAIIRPGQFAQVQLPGFYLRRPISVCDWDAETLTLVYKVVGQGTEAMATYQPGMTLDLLTGLGNGFDIASCGKRPLLVGGGVGLPPLVGLCKRLLAEGKAPTVLAGFGTASEVFLRDAVEAMGVPFVLTTVDGSAGIQGMVTDALSGLAFDSVCACGPLPMLRAVDAATSCHGQFSFEERMGCGFGACMGCSVKVKGGYKRICKDGPVLRKEEILW